MIRHISSVNIGHRHRDNWLLTDYSDYNDIILFIQTEGGLLKLNGLRGGERDAVTLPAGVAVGQYFFRKTSDLYTF